MITASLRHCYANLLTFTGRDTRAQFWPFALVNLAIAIAAMAGLIVPVVLGAISKAEAFAAANPDKVIVTQTATSRSITFKEPVPGLMPDFDGMITPVLIGGVVFIALHAAAVVRRLHDTERGGWIGLIPAVLFVVAGALMRQVFAQFGESGAPDLGPFFIAWQAALAYNVSLIMLVILLVLPTKVTGNRYARMGK